MNATQLLWIQNSIKSWAGAVLAMTFYTFSLYHIYLHFAQMNSKEFLFVGALNAATLIGALMCVGQSFVLLGDGATVLNSGANKMLFVKRLSEHAIVPQQNGPDDAGLDLFSAVDQILKGTQAVIPLILDDNYGNRGLFPTDLSIAIPPGCYGRIAPRSGLAWKQGIDVLAGVIDRSYRGNVAVVLINHSKHDVHIKKGDKIAQLILERYTTPSKIEVVPELTETMRGAKGFGSSG